MRGNPKKGYRLDPGHPSGPHNKPHINYWDYTKGKSKSGKAIKDAVMID